MKSLKLLICVFLLRQWVILLVKENLSKEGQFMFFYVIINLIFVVGLFIFRKIKKNQDFDLIILVLLFYTLRPILTLMSYTDLIIFPEPYITISMVLFVSEIVLFGISAVLIIKKYKISNRFQFKENQSSQSNTRAGN